MFFIELNVSGTSEGTISYSEFLVLVFLLNSILSLTITPMIRTKNPLKKMPRKENGPANPPMKTQSERLLRTTRSIHGNTQRRTTKKEGLESEYFESRSRKNALLAPQVKVKIEIRILTVWAVDTFPVLNIMTSCVTA